MNEKKQNQTLYTLNITVVAIVALVAIVGVTAIVLNGPAAARAAAKAATLDKTAVQPALTAQVVQSDSLQLNMPSQDQPRQWCFDPNSDAAATPC